MDEMPCTQPPPMLTRHERRQRRMVSELARLLGGYEFRSPDLLTEALTHCSYSVGPCNQVITGCIIGLFLVAVTTAPRP